MLDEARFAALWARLNLRGDARSTWELLSHAYAEPGRAYHTAEHIRDCLLQLDLEPGAALRPDEVEFALWFHDVVYDPHASDNEERSAAQAADTLAAAGARAEVRERIRSLVLATRHEEPAEDRDAQVVTDIDLSILGRAPAMFAEFERRIRQEYAWVPDLEYRPARRAVLTRFLQREPLYRTEEFRRRYEASAKHNLRLAIGRLLME